MMVTSALVQGGEELKGVESGRLYLKDSFSVHFDFWPVWGLPSGSASVQNTALSLHQIFVLFDYTMPVVFSGIYWSLSPLSLSVFVIFCGAIVSSFLFLSEASSVLGIWSMRWVAFIMQFSNCSCIQEVVRLLFSGFDWVKLVNLLINSAFSLSNKPWSDIVDLIFSTFSCHLIPSEQ